MVSGEMKASSWTEYYSAVGGGCVNLLLYPGSSQVQDVLLSL